MSPGTTWHPQMSFWRQLMATPCTLSEARCFPKCIFVSIRLVNSHNSNAFLQAKTASQMHFWRRFMATPCTCSRARCFPKCIFVIIRLIISRNSNVFLQANMVSKLHFFETIHGDSLPIFSRQMLSKCVFVSIHSTRHFSQPKCISPSQNWHLKCIVGDSSWRLLAHLLGPDASPHVFS